MPLIGTAGHVDHGKSTLIVALTGRDPDRLDEEKKRGLTIDLGFAWADLGDGEEVSFVDVPGHERYLKNMLAGVDAIDVALLVVASNEGWMPQTEEHAAVLDLLGVEKGVVALTKTDLVDPASVEDQAREIENRLEGTALARYRVVPVSAPQGTGLTQLRHELIQCLAETEQEHIGRPRLWIDRSFTIAGAGTVVTGSLIGGQLSEGDDVEVYPSQARARVRSVQSHEKRLTRAAPGFRVALGLSGIDVRTVGRGDMVGLPGDWDLSDRFAATVKKARYVEELPARAAFQMHVGTATVNARLTRSRGDQVLIRTTEPLPVASGDRLILRDTGRRLVVAGGIVNDPRPVKGSLLVDWASARDRDKVADLLLSLRGIEDPSTIAAHSNGGTALSGIAIGDSILSPERLEAIVSACERHVAADHDKNPLRNGMPLATLAATIGVSRTIVEEAVSRSAQLESRGPDVALASHRPSLDEESERKWRDTESLLAQGLAVPRVDELPLSGELIHLLSRRGELVRISDDLAYLPGQVEEIKEAVRSLGVPFGVGDFKEATGLSRKYVMPLLEWLDANEYTIRRSEGRVHGPELSGGQ
ncbi:MAG: selenocysteine-specific translation elongation factor [Actinobacteria bacterium]|nr:MAG: selenocysteine-specific translation elongation factor [Actinomycetota bacterium]